MNLLEVKDIVVEASSRLGPIRILDGVSIDIAPGEIVGLVGESGSGKSTTAAAIMKLFTSPSVTMTDGEIWLDGERIDDLPPEGMAKIRGARIAQIFQDPSTYLDPMMSVGKQVAEGLRVHKGKGDHRARVVELLTQMGLPDPEHMAHRFPHELSGGQRQRVLIAAALAADPSLLIADEPSTALDVTVQAQILALLRDLREELGLSILFITHDLGVVAEMCDRVYVMYAGKVVEGRTIHELYDSPAHPYTVGLLNSTFSVDEDVEALFSVPGTVPDMRAMPSGCRFRTRCILADEKCALEEPPLEEVPGGTVACWHKDLVDPKTLWRAGNVSVASVDSSNNGLSAGGAA